MSNRFTALILGLILAAGCLPLAAQTYTFQRIQFPNMPDGDTTALGINNRGAVVGWTIGFWSGFGSAFKLVKCAWQTLPCYGVFERPVANSDGANVTGTVATGINEYGVIVGYHPIDPAFGVQKGFLLSQGVFTDYSIVPGQLTRINGINNKGDFVGIFEDANQVQHGFVSIDGVVSPIDCPGGSDTVAYGIAADRTIVGSCYKNSMTNGFIRGPAGQYKYFTIAGTRSTVMTAINNAAHKIVGYSFAPGAHGFVYDYITDQITTADAGGEQTFITGINSQSVIVGWQTFHEYRCVMGWCGYYPRVSGFVGTPQ